jgi:hypothetical protein
MAIASDRDLWFRSAIWGKFRKLLGPKLHFSTAFHPHLDGLAEKANDFV